MNCRGCGHHIPEPLISMGNFPLSNAYRTKEELHQTESFYPMDLYVCGWCWLVQLAAFEAAENIFTKDYPYFSSCSESWLKYCRDYAISAIKRFRLTPHSLVVEIGSNDGYLLQYFKEAGIPVLGIDPAVLASRKALDKGIPTETTFFDTAFARDLLSRGLQADLIIANNVLPHNPRLHEFIAGLRLVLKPGCSATLEFPHLQQLITQNQFDTIYQEHYSYFSLGSVAKLFCAHDLQIYDAERIQTHGGSLRVYVKSGRCGLHPGSSNIGRILDEEASAGLFQFQTYFEFWEKTKKIKRDMLQLLIAVKNQGRKIVGYGAPAKGNTLLNFCGISTDFLDYTVDRNRYKQGLFLPGSHIPIKDPARLKADRPDYVLILPWNIKDEIMEQLSFIREWNGRFIVPIPDVTVI
ncbi:MAG: class I SAM-dependent methyltransferase [Bacillota bacterium]|nr:class I SAM-dependent methyltransferase [Bacillota bacterium]MDW7684823.1 class I SAM-dependent methyltransferase [Bacillota bacterium]